MTLSIHLLLYLLVFMAHAWAFRKRSLVFFDPKQWPENIRVHFVLLGAGILFWGLLPWWYYGHRESVALLWNPEKPSPVWLAGILIVAMIVLGLGIWQAKLSVVSEDLATIRPKPEILAVYFSLRILFLISYEMWFRGWFLLEAVDEVGKWAAIGTNIALYSLIHVFAGKKMALFSLPFGALLCIISLQSEALWPAVLIHLFLSMGFEGKFMVRLNRIDASR